MAVAKRLLCSHSHEATVIPFCRLTTNKRARLHSTIFLKKGFLLGLLIRVKGFSSFGGTKSEEIYVIFDYYYYYKSARLLSTIINIQYLMISPHGQKINYCVASFSGVLTLFLCSSVIIIDLFY